MSDTETERNPSDYAIVGRLASRLADPDFPTGDHAALRRMDPRAPGRAGVVLYRLIVDVGLDPAGDRLRHWALVSHCLALVRGAHSKDIATGAALQALPMTELRLNQLLAADQDVLFDLLPGLARRLAAKGSALNWAPLAMLALYGDRESSDCTRLEIARDFARAAKPE